MVLDGPGAPGPALAKGRRAADKAHDSVVGDTHSQGTSLPWAESVLQEVVNTSYDKPGEVPDRRRMAPQTDGQCLRPLRGRTGDPVPPHFVPRSLAVVHHRFLTYGEITMSENNANTFHEMEPLDDWARTRQELESIRDRFADALLLLMPGVDHRLMTLPQGEWPHSAALRLQILDWLEDVLLSGDGCEPNEQTLLGDDGRSVHVLAKHLLDDNWWVSVAGVRAINSGDDIAGTGPGVALAIARIKGSGRRLPYNAHTSSRFS